MDKKHRSPSVLITGGTGSVGEELVAAFATSKYRVFFQYGSNQASAKKLEKKFGAKAIQLDLDHDFILPKADFDVLINNAGINTSDVPTHEVSIEVWDSTLRINLTSPFRLARQCLPYMMQKGWGRIINISSIYGLRGVEGRFPYTVSKHGLSGFTKTIAREYAINGITCNEICPGPINSDMMRDIARRHVAKEGGTVKSYFKKEVFPCIPANRMAEPRDVSALALFLASRAAGYLTGASIPLDGGMIA